MSDLSDLEGRLHAIPDESLLESLAEGPGAFQPGVFDVYLQEARHRGLSVDTPSLEQVKAAKHQCDLQERGKRLVLVAYLLLGISGGLGGFIPSLQLVFRRDSSGAYVFEKRQRVHGYIAGSISLLAWLILLVVVITRLV